ncbi:MAG TPA: UMP kinase [Geminicoccaceae bacterium]|nr:UMP kinase [Geminicoccaceae bacterium]
MTETANRPLRFRRVLLKMSGEALMGEGEFGHDASVLRRLAAEVQAVHAHGVEQCLVIGGGNIVRGDTLAASQDIERANADYMGMLATVINALAVQSVLERLDLQTRVLSAIPMAAVCEPYIRRRAIRHMEKGRIVLCAAGTGNPFFTTDTAAALRAAELGCDALLKGTKVDGVYSADPVKDPNALRYDRLTYHDVLARDLKVMDASAIALARDSAIPIIVFSLNRPGGLLEVLRGEGPHTMIGEDASVAKEAGS